MINASARAVRALNSSIGHVKHERGTFAVAAGLRALTWAVLYVGDQLKRQADFWEGGPGR